MVNELITITERDVAGQTLVCCDLERNLWFRFGFPKNSYGYVDSELFQNLEGPPYVFQADTIDLFDDSHPGGIRLENVMVIFMHAGREEGGEWVFSSFENGYPVVATVRAVNSYLVEHGLPEITVVMGCNDFESPSGVKVGDFSPGENVVYAVGEAVGFLGADMMEDGTIHFRAVAHDFWNLDTIHVGQQIRVVSKDGVEL